MVMPVGFDNRSFCAPVGNYCVPPLVTEVTTSPLKRVHPFSTLIAGIRAGRDRVGSSSIHLHEVALHLHLCFLHLLVVVATGNLGVYHPNIFGGGGWG
jgi:hypothetical protein